MCPFHIYPFLAQRGVSRRLPHSRPGPAPGATRPARETHAAELDESGAYAHGRASIKCIRRNECRFPAAAVDNT